MTEVVVNAEPLTYHEHAPHSYFRDLVVQDWSDEARARQRRHAEEMDVITRERDQRAWRSLWAGELEYRVEPNRTDGQGGYFSPPLWLNELFATAKRPGRVLAGLMQHFDLPAGASSVNLPIISTGTQTEPVEDNQAQPDQDVVDAAGSSTVVTISGEVEAALQLLEQSPPGAHLDSAFFKDLTEDFDYKLEIQLLNGSGSANNQILGVVQADNPITYTSGSPTAGGMWTYFGQAAAQLGDNRQMPPEAWLMRTARWSWLTTAEDTQGRPFGLSSPFFLGSDEKTPDPAGGLVSWPVFLDDAIPATLGAGGNQDQVICLRPTDLMLFESNPVTAVMREPLSGQIGVRIQLHCRVAAITNRYPGGIYVLGGSGFVVQSGF